MRKLTIPAVALAATLALSSCGNSESQKKAEQNKIPKIEQTDKPQKETKDKVKEVIIEVDENRDNLLSTLKSVGLYNKEMRTLMSLFDKMKKDPESLRPPNFDEDIYPDEPNISLPEFSRDIDKKDMLVLFTKNKEALLPLINILSPAGKRVALEWIDEYEVLANHKLSDAKMSSIKSALAKSTKLRKEEGYDRDGQGASIIKLHAKGSISILDARAYLFQREYGEENIGETLKEIKEVLEK